MGARIFVRIDRLRTAMQGFGTTMVACVRRKFAVLMALLCLSALCSGDFMRGFHLLTTRHVVCAVHGDLVEADSAPRSSGETTRDVPAYAPGSGAVAHHEHCSIAATPTRVLAAEIRAAALVRVSPRSDEAVAGSEMERVRGRAVFAYAPKQGPPVRVG